MGTTRRKFGAEFKREAARQALQPGDAVDTVVQDLGMHESVLRCGLKEYGSGPAYKAAERPLKNAQTREIERLKRELTQVKMEREINIQPTQPNQRLTDNTHSRELCSQ